MPSWCAIFSSSGRMPGRFFTGFGGSTYYLRCDAECEVLSAACEVRSVRQFNHNLMMVSASAAQALACS